MLTDQGTNQSEVMNILYKTYTKNRLETNAYRPQCDGIVALTSGHASLHIQFTRFSKTFNLTYWIFKVIIIIFICQIKISNEVVFLSARWHSISLRSSKLSQTTRLLVTGKTKTKTVGEFRNKNNGKTAIRKCILTTAKHK